jgi:hypothetical protein
VLPHCHADQRVHYLRSHSRGSNFARTEGVSAGSAPYILFTDDDCFVEPGWQCTHFYADPTFSSSTRV